MDRKLNLLLLPKDAADDRSAILEIRAGTGGDEASLFASDLFRMYYRYSDLHGWKFEPIEVAETDVGGVREAVVEIAGRGVFAHLKMESRVHRVQRVPETESGEEYTLQLQLSLFWPKQRKWTLRSMKKIYVLIPLELRELGVSMLTKLIVLFA